LLPELENEGPLTTYMIEHRLGTPRIYTAPIDPSKQIAPSDPLPASVRNRVGTMTTLSIWPAGYAWGVSRSASGRWGASGGTRLVRVSTASPIFTSSIFSRSDSVNVWPKYSERSLAANTLVPIICGSDHIKEQTGDRYPSGDLHHRNRHLWQHDLQGIRPDGDTCERARRDRVGLFEGVVGGHAVSLQHPSLRL
jgi:hypothetical protein